MAVLELVQFETKDINFSEPIHIPDRHVHSKEVQMKLDFYDTFIERVTALVRT